MQKNLLHTIGIYLTSYEHDTVSEAGNLLLLELARQIRE